MISFSEKFLNQLRDSLRHLPNVEVEKAISYYKEMIQDRVEDGMSEETAVKSLGKIENIVASVEEDIPLDSLLKEKITNKINKTSNMSTGLKVLIGLIIILGSPIWLSIFIGIGFVVIGIIIAVWSIYISLNISYGTLLIYALASVVVGIISITSMDILSSIYYFGTSMICLGVFIVLLKPAIWCNKQWFKLNAKPLKWIKKKLIK